jgi:hypothetical protein
MQIEEAMQTSEAMNSNVVKQITPAKRQKMETENDNTTANCQNEQPRVGLAQQASPRQ